MFTLRLGVGSGDQSLKLISLFRSPRVSCVTESPFPFGPPDTFGSRIEVDVRRLGVVMTVNPT